MYNKFLVRNVLLNRLYTSPNHPKKHQQYIAKTVHNNEFFNSRLETPREANNQYLGEICKDAAENWKAIVYSSAYDVLCFYILALPCNIICYRFIKNFATPPSYIPSAMICFIRNYLPIRIYT